jgi:hypothetical protein
MIITSLHNIPILKTLCGEFNFLAIICGGEFAAAALLVAALNNDGITCEIDLVLPQRANMMAVHNNASLTPPQKSFSTSRLKMSNGVNFYSRPGTLIIFCIQLHSTKEKLAFNLV